jgi:hypothetical protein
MRGKQLLRREWRVGDAVAKHPPVEADPRHPLVAIALARQAGSLKQKRSPAGCAFPRVARRSPRASPAPGCLRALAVVGIAAPGEGPDTGRE